MSDDTMDDSETGKDKLAERVALRVALEVYPLREASIPPCRLRSIALSKGTKGGHLLLYLGTDTGQLLLFTISAAPSSQIDSPANDTSAFSFPAGARADLRDGQISPSEPPSLLEHNRGRIPDGVASIKESPFSSDPVEGRTWTSSSSFSSYLNASTAFDAVSVKSSRDLTPRPQSPSPLSLIQKHSSSSSSNHIGLPSGPLTDAASYQFSPLPSPPLSIAPSLDDDVASRDDGFGLGPMPGAPPSVYLSEYEDSRAKSKESEHSIVLRARKSISRGSVDGLCVLPDAGRIAVLSDDLVALVDYNTLGALEVLHPTKGASAMARWYQSEGEANKIFGDAGSGLSSLENHKEPHFAQLFASQPAAQLADKWTNTGSLSSKFGDIRGVFGFSKLSGQVGSGVTGLTGKPGAASARLAVAVKKKLLLFEVFVRKDRKERVTARLLKEVVGMDGVVTLAWLGDVVFAGSLQEYTIFSLSTGQATPLFSLPKDLSGPPLLKPFPEDCGVLLTVDTLGILVDAGGIPRTGSVLFTSVPDAVASSASFVVAAAHGHVELYHRRTGRKVQTLLTDMTEGPSILADSEDGTFLVVANSSKVWCFQQASVDEQVKELLKQKDYSEAVQVAKECVDSGGGDTAIARLGFVHVEAGFLLIFDLCFEEAIDQLLEANVFQPFELFPFFPSLTSRWRSVTPRKRYWGLHPPPQPIERIIDSGLKELQSALYGQEPAVKSRGLPVKDATARRQEFVLLAMKSFVRYFSVVRQRQLSTEEKEGVDTVLMKLYIQLGFTEELEQLARFPNSCILEEVEGLLKSSGQLRTLAMLYENKELVLPALQVWQSLALRQVPGQRTVGKSADTVSAQGNVETEAATEAARLLEVSNDSDIVLDHISWILQLSEDLALHVLASALREKPLPAEKVLALLQTEGGSLRRRYLQWLVQDQGSLDSYHHTELALSLARAARSSLKDCTASSPASSTILYSNVDPSHTAQLREVFQNFLESSSKYAPELILQEIQNSELWHEQVTLHQKLGDEISALRILALNLEDYQAAEQYCVELGRPDAYMQLLDIYLKPGYGKEPLHRAAVRLLHRQALTLDPLRILEAMPSDMPLPTVSHTVACLLRARVHCQLEGQMVKHLVRAGNLEARVERVDELSRHVQITMDSTCGSCHARIGTKPFGLSPKNSVLCYKCLRLHGIR